MISGTTPATGTSGKSKNDSVLSAAPPSFAVVIPMYNEEAGAEACVRLVCRELATLPHHTRLIVVDDGSNDRTAEILRRLQTEEPRLSLIAHSHNRGYGAALRTGAALAHDQGFEYVLFMDSDLTNQPSDIPRFASAMEQRFDVIKASRYAPGGGVAGVPFKRAIISRIGNLIARFLFRLPIRDCTNGFRAVKSSVLAKLHLQETGFAVIVEELYQCKFHAHSFCEIPVILTNRDQYRRHSSFVYKPSIFWRYLKYGILAFLRISPQHGQLRSRKWQP